MTARSHDLAQAGSRSGFSRLPTGTGLLPGRPFGRVAVTWIKMRVGLMSDPAVLGMARTLGLGRHEVVGRLYALWAWADENTEDGNLPGLSAADIDDVAGHEGFAKAMAATKPSPWLSLSDAGVSFPKFSRHNGKSAKRRALQAERMAASRMRTECAQPAHKSVTREEKIREEENGARAPTGPCAPPTRARGPQEGPALRGATEATTAPGEGVTRNASLPSLVAGLEDALKRNGHGG